jgi:cell division protein FtsL
MGLPALTIDHAEGYLRPHLRLVWLSAEAAQATLQSARLREQIKATRFEGDMLEVQESQLASPARIQRIASRDLDMAVAEKTTFIDLRAGASKRRPAAAAEGKRSGPAMLPGVVDSVVGVAAGEARVLLVGDVGLASTH